jgi:hypothetical protein
MRLRINLNNVEGEFMAAITENLFTGFVDGDEVEVILKGTFRRGGFTGLCFVGEHIVPAPIVQSVRRLEPEYEVGEVYESATGAKYTRMTDGWRGCISGRVVSLGMPTRPLRKLTVQ